MSSEDMEERSFFTWIADRNTHIIQRTHKTPFNSTILLPTLTSKAMMACPIYTTISCNTEEDQGTNKMTWELKLREA